MPSFFSKSSTMLGVGQLMPKARNSFPLITVAICPVVNTLRPSVMRMGRLQRTMAPFMGSLFPGLARKHVQFVLPDGPWMNAFIWGMSICVLSRTTGLFRRESEQPTSIKTTTQRNPSDFIYLSGLRYVPLPHSRSNNGSRRPLRSGRGVSQRPIKRRQFLLPKSHFGGLARSRGRCVPGLVKLQNALPGLAGLLGRCSRVGLELAPAVQDRK